MNNQDRTMTTERKRPGASASKLHALRVASLDSTYVSLGSRRTSSPHEFYRYPARFPPTFAKAAIEAFTRPGDLVLDPFVGGGTTLVEARLGGRLAVGSDLNPLAVFVSRVKTRPLTPSDLCNVSHWLDRLPGVLSTRGRIERGEWSRDGYLKNIDGEAFASVRNPLHRAMTSLASVRPRASADFARCILLRAGQWALDMRMETPSREEFLTRLVDMGEAMVEAAHAYRRAVRASDARSDAHGRRRTTILRQALPGLSDRLVGRIPAPKLILTSPPYPGVYVNYHRWKVLGRKETPAPFWLANELDGNGIGHYTMDARTDRSLGRYFAHLEGAYRDLAHLAGSKTVLVQMVGFHNPAKDLPRYLATMRRAGFEETKLADLGSDSRDGRLWRGVPNRRWWVQDGSKGVHTAQEVLLVHKKS